MLKQPVKEPKLQNEDPAAFRRLCVETSGGGGSSGGGGPAAFRRLCVETI